MQGAYDRTLLDYYFIPFSMFTTRIYYNRELYQQIIGSDVPPQTYQDLMDACQKITDYSKKNNLRLVPIAGSKYQVGRFEDSYGTAFYYKPINEFDTDYNGTTDVFETYLAYKDNRWSFTDDRFIRSRECTLDIAKYFQDGWQAALRDDSAFLFVQGNAVMIASGSWDAPSLKKQSEGQFTLGIFDFPLPTDDPVYGQYVKYPKTEASIRGGIPWSINASSNQKDLAIDFLRFCTTKKNNEKFNLAITWLPVVRGTKLSPDLVPFKPRVKGFSGAFRYDISTEVKVEGAGKLWNLYSGSISANEYGEVMKELYDRSADDGYENELIKVRRNFRNLERLMASQTSSSQFLGTSNDPRQIERFQQLMQSTSDFSYKVASNQALFEAVQDDKETE